MKILDLRAVMDGSFLIDEKQLHQRRESASRALHVMQIPLMRLLGLCLLSFILLLHDLGAGLGWQPALGGIMLFNLAYGLLTWGLLRRWHGRSGRLDLPLLLMHADLLVYLLNLHHVEPAQPLFAALLLTRVADQLGFGFRRAFYFNHVVLVAYLGYAGLMALLETSQERAGWNERLVVALMMYLAGLYLSLIGLVTQRLRERVRQGVRAARGLVERLEQQKQELQAQKQELQAQTQALEWARAQAEAASSAKSQFLTLMSHELRTPLHGVLGMVQLLQESTLTPAQRHQADVALQSGLQLETLLQELLDLTEMEAGQLQLQPRRFNFATLTQTLAQRMQPLLAGRPVQLQLQVDPALARDFYADETRLRQLLFHLLHNGAKFTDAGEVRLQAQVGAEDAARVQLQVRVSDTGRGMSAEELGRVFALFELGDGSSTRRHGGAGLGLAVVRRLVDGFGATLDIRARDGGGTEVLLGLSLAKAV